MTIKRNPYPIPKSRINAMQWSRGLREPLYDHRLNGVRRAINRAQAVWFGTPFDKRMAMFGFRYFIQGLVEQAT